MANEQFNNQNNQHKIRNMNQTEYQGYNFIKHSVGELINGIQRCVICGEIIADYTNIMIAPQPDGTIPKLSGWDSGDLFVSETKNPQLFTTIVNPEKDKIKNCQ